MTKSKSSFNKFLNICLAVLASAFFLIILFVVLGQTLDLRDAWEGYVSLSRQVEIIEEPVPQTDPYESPAHVSAFDAEMRDKNPDYVCWLKIDGADISYPVVRGEDNEKYLNHTFWGENNTYGSLFMDYRCEGEYVPNIIIYGHNARGGNMFGDLRKFLNEEYLSEHPVITLIENDRVIEYEIFSVRRTDINDPAYFVDFSAPGAFETFLERNDAPPDAAQILTLSTCVTGTNKNARLIVQGCIR